MEDFNLVFPIDQSMIKKEQRIISGIATADNVDKAGDIVDFTASIDAFKKWGGNIREMHAPVAVGKAVNYEPIKIKDEDGKEYNAIRVEAYISKGAENTWQKILDGTLRAFSIGGKIIEKVDTGKKMSNGRAINIIKKYTLGELSIVDNPANAMAVVDIVKMNQNTGDLEYVLEQLIEKAKKQPLKDPKGGLTAAGRRHFKQTEGANLKPGVKGPANTPEKMRRKGSFLTRFFTNPSGPMKDEKGRPTRLALSAAAWGEPVPQNRSDAAKLAAKGRRLLERYAKIKKKSIDDIFTEDDELLLKQMEYFNTIDYDELLNMEIEMADIQKSAPTKREAGENFPAAAFAYVPDPQSPSTWKLRLWESMDAKVTAAQVGRAIAAVGKGFRGNKVQIPSEDLPAVKRKIMNAWKQTHEGYKPEDVPEVLKMQQDSLQNDVNYDKVFNMNEQEQEKLSLIKRVVNWLVPDVEENASTELKVEVTNNTQEEEDMDIEVLKDALSAVVDEKLANFATSIKEEVEASVQEKIDTITKGFEVTNTELQEKLEATEKALADQEEQVKAFAEAGAIKKSVDPEDDEEGEEITKSAPESFWGNLYLPQGLVKTLGYKA